MNVITVNINGVEYNLRGEENEEYLHKVARYVDKKIKHILDSNKKLSLSSAAVLTAINSVDDMFKCGLAFDDMQGELEQTKDTEKKLREELEAVRKQFKYLEDYNTELQNKLKSMSNENYLKQKEEELSKVSKELEITQESAKKYLQENKILKTENSDLRFQIQTYKYKTMDLQHKLIEKGIDLAKEKKLKNPLLATDL